MDTSQLIMRGAIRSNDKGFEANLNEETPRRNDVVVRFYVRGRPCTELLRREGGTTIDSFQHLGDIATESTTRLDIFYIS